MGDWIALLIALGILCSPFILMFIAVAALTAGAANMGIDAATDRVMDRIERREQR